MAAKVYTYAVKSPLVTMARPKFAPKSTPSHGPIPKFHYLPHAWTRPTYDAKRHPDLIPVSPQCPKYSCSKNFVRAEGDAAASPLDPPLLRSTSLSGFVNGNQQKEVNQTLQNATK